MALLLVGPVLVTIAGLTGYFFLSPMVLEERHRTVPDKWFVDAYVTRRGLGRRNQLIPRKTERVWMKNQVICIRNQLFWSWNQPKMVTEPAYCSVNQVSSRL